MDSSEPLGEDGRIPRQVLVDEQAGGRLSGTASVDAAAFALVGACMHHAFLGTFSDLGSVDYQEEEFGPLADGIVATVLHGISP
jgi:hypothetical protein